MPTAEAQVLLERLTRAHARAEAFFDALPNLPRNPYLHLPRDHYWTQLSAEEQGASVPLVAEVIDLGHEASLAVKRSALLGAPDVTAVGHCVKGMRAALQLRRYREWDADVLHDEGTVLGVTPAGFAEDEPYHPDEAKQRFSHESTALWNILQLVGPAAPGEPTTRATDARGTGYRPGTAFIMMSMQPDHPELTDVCDAVKRCFARFGVQALRADDIEHEDVITRRILDEIRTAEFLFADLSGERPSVYYEIGYAHALQRRVMLFRKRGTVIHFDLAAYNCPEYENLRGLEEQLTRRLEHTTGQRGEDQTPTAT